MVVCAVRYEPVYGGSSLLTGKLTGNFAILGPQKPISLHETTVLQRLFTKFPTQINRENILKNREISGKNREIWLASERPVSVHFSHAVSVHFSHTCLFKIRTRSVLTEKFSGGERDVVSSRAVWRGFLAGAPRGLASR